MGDSAQVPIWIGTYIVQKNMYRKLVHTFYYK